MNENLEVVKLIYKDAEASISSLTTLLNELENKDNKIKGTIENILKGYERYLKDAKRILTKDNVEPEKMTIISKVMANMGIDKKVKQDNSDASMASMLIKGISIDAIDIEKKMKQYEKNLDKKTVKLAEDFKKFQQENIEALKKHL